LYHALHFKEFLIYLLKFFKITESTIKYNIYMRNKIIDELIQIKGNRRIYEKVWKHIVASYWRYPKGDLGIWP